MSRPVWDGSIPDIKSPHNHEADALRPGEEPGLLKVGVAMREVAMSEATCGSCGAVGLVHDRVQAGRPPRLFARCPKCGTSIAFD